MSAAQLGAVMDEVALRMKAWGEFEEALFPRAYPWPNPSVSPPAFVVGFPPQVDFDGAYDRGMDRIPDLPAWAVFGGPDTLSGRDHVIEHCLAVKARLEADPGPNPESPAWSSARVKTVAFETVANDDGTEFLAAKFTIDIAT